jgi:PAS domain S-box-containing protein
MKLKEKSKSILLQELKEMQRKVAELEALQYTAPGLKDKEEKIRSALRRFANFLPQTYYEIDGKGNLTFINDYGLCSFGYTEDDLKKGIRPTDAFVEADRNRAAKNLERVMREGTARGNEYVAQRKDGTTFPVMAYSAPIRRDGKCVGIRGILVETTALKETEDALRKSESRIRAIVDTAVDGIIVVDEKGTIESVNAAVEHILGYSVLELIGRNVRMLMPEPYQSEHDKYISDYLESGVKKVIGNGRELEALKKDGTTFPIYLAVSETRLGDQILFTGIIRDISKRKRAERLLKKKNEELTAFSYMVSHDLKAPLRGILGYAQELVQSHETEVGERGRFCLHQIMAASDNMDQLIEDLLQYSRIDREDLEITEVHLSELIASITNEKSRSIEESGVQINSNLSVASLRCWHRGLLQVLGNLIDNAIKFSRHVSQPTITIGAEEDPKVCRISVADNGVGFDMKYHDQLFKLFQRGVRKEEFEGTGAGLAIAKKIVERQDGRIWATSRPGEGATFYVALPKTRHPALDEVLPDG